jgi:hypothetical protein
MPCFNDIPEPGLAHVGVDLGGREICVTEHGLDRAKIRPALQQIRCEGMSEYVG